MSSWTCVVRVLSVLASVVLLQSQRCLGQNEELPNPFQVDELNFGSLPEDRPMGQSSTVVRGGDDTIWVVDRCGNDTCVGSDLNPIVRFGTDGTVLAKFGAGLFVWPHGAFVDPEENVWVADAVGPGPEQADKGHVVIKLSALGEHVLTLGTAGVAGNTNSTFNKPSAVVVTYNGTVFVADGLEATGNNRIVKFDSRGEYLYEWGTSGTDIGQFAGLSSLAIDLSTGLLFVGDRGNNRIQVFDQDGHHQETLLEFGRPSGLFIHHSIIYVADSGSGAANPGFARGIRIGRTSDYRVTGFVPQERGTDPEDETSGVEGVCLDDDGHLYGARVLPVGIIKYIHAEEPSTGLGVSLEIIVAAVAAVGAVCAIGCFCGMRFYKDKEYQNVVDL